MYNTSSLPSLLAFPLQELYIIDSAGKQTLVEACEKMVRLLL